MDWRPRHQFIFRNIIKVTKLFPFSFLIFIIFSIFILTNDYKNRDYIESCYTQLIANIEELNIDAGIDEVQVHHSQDGSIASFKVINS